MTILRLPAILCLLASLAGAESWRSYYALEDIALPEGVPPEVGGLAFDPQGDLYVCLRRGDVFRAKPTADPKGFAWTHFASGFHNGCGLHVPEPGRAVVSQMAELTEAVDTDGDGTADTYNRLADGWGVSGNYHETNALTPDGKGGYYLAVGTASHNGPTFFHTRDAYSSIGRRGRNYSSVRFRGWVLHYAPDGSLTPVASGFRMHNGIYRDPDGRLWCGDNQGDWKATTPLYLVEQGNFYGHPSSLVWDERWPKDKDPLATYRADLEAYNENRTLPVVQIPHGEVNRSASDPIELPRDGSFSKAFAGQLLLADNNGTRLTRIMLDEVNGTLQGSCTHFVDGGGLRSGNNRLVFSPNGKSLYIGQTVRGWGRPAEGLQRLTSTGRDPFDVSGITLTKDGFEFRFSAGLAEGALDGALPKVSSFTYQSKWTYGSPKEDGRTHQATWSRQEPALLACTIEGLSAGRVYKIELPALEAADGRELLNRTCYYTANEVPE